MPYGHIPATSRRHRNIVLRLSLGILMMSFGEDGDGGQNSAESSIFNLIISHFGLIPYELGLLPTTDQDRLN
jgi:hypothetical protein